MRCASCGAEPAPKRCGHCKAVMYCDVSCQRSHWKSHKAACAVFAASLLRLGRAEPLVEAARVATRGAAGWSHFVIDDVDYLCVANFFTSRPGARPNMTTTSTVYSAVRAGATGLALAPVAEFETTGAHGVEHVAGPAGDHYLVVPNYYGGDAVVVKWTGETFAVSQRLPVDGGGNVVAFRVGEERFVSIAEFNTGRVLLFVLRDGTFGLTQRLQAPGCGATSAAWVDGRLYLVAASYVTRETGWRTRSHVFERQPDGRFTPHHELATVGAHGAATMTTRAGGHYLFLSNDKDQTSTLQDSELFQWRDGKYASVQRVRTDGAHAAEIFEADGRAFLAVANLGDRARGTYRRMSHLYALDPSADPPLALVQELGTRGATDFRAFAIGGMTFLAVSNEQDDARGGDIESTIWALPRPGKGRGEL